LDEVAFGDTSTMQGYGRGPKMADHHQNYYSLDIGYHPELPISEAKRNTWR